MVPNSLTIALAVLTLGIGLGFTYFGYTAVTRLTSLVGGLGGAFLGSLVARQFVAPAFATGSQNLLVLSLVGVVVGGLFGSWFGRSVQRLAIATLSVAVSGALVYSAVSSPGVGTTLGSSLGLGSVNPLIASLVASVVVGILVWQFYLPFLGVVTSLFGAAVLQFAARTWANALPVLHPDLWATLGTNHLVWILLVGSGVALQYRRYRAARSRVSLWRRRRFASIR